MSSDKAKTKQERPKTAAQLLLARNLKYLIDTHPELNSAPKLAARCGIDPTMINRILRSENAPSVVTMEAITEALGVPVWRLLAPENPSDLAAWTIQALSEKPSDPPRLGKAQPELRQSQPSRVIASR